MKLVQIVIILSYTLAFACRPRPNNSITRSKSLMKDESICLFGTPASSTAERSSEGELSPLTLQIMRSTAEASRVAYRDKTQIENMARSWGYEKVTHLQDHYNSSITAFLMSNSHCAVLVFSGTQPSSLRSWLVDTSVGNSPVTHGNVHRGFHDVIVHLWVDIKSALAEHDVINKVFWVTGHSLGGALAGLFGYKVELDGASWGIPAKIDRIMTFGQPLFGDKFVAGYMGLKFNGRYFRIVNDTDAFARLPYWFYGAGSVIWLKQEKIDFIPASKGGRGLNLAGGATLSEQQLPTELTLSKEESLVYNEKILSLPDNALDPSGRSQSNDFALNSMSVVPQWLKDHYLDEYRERIAKLLAQRGL